MSKAVPYGRPAEKRRSLVTPEGVDLKLQLADAGQRIGAFLLDLMIMLAALFAITMAALLTAFGSGLETAGIIWLLGFFLIRNFYFILMEKGPRAATFGKRALGLRVVARTGERLSVDRVIARNLMRELEFYLPLSFIAYNSAQDGGSQATAWMGLGWAAIFLFFPLFNKDRLRIGDVLAGTWVINSPKRKLGFDLADERPEEAFAFTPEQLDVYGVYELQTLEDVLRDERGQSVSAVAETIRYKIGAPWTSDDRAFLTAYYEAARAHMERNLLFGRRREHKHDRAEAPAEIRRLGGGRP